MSNPYAPPGSRPAGRPESRPTPARQPPPPAPPTTPGPRPPRRPPADPEAARVALARCGEFALLVLAGLVVMLIELPWQATSMLFFLAGIGFGIRALRRCLKAHLGGSVTLAVALGLVATGLLVLVELVVLLTWPSTERTQRCVSQALTVQAHDACVAAQTAQLNTLFGR